MIIREYQEADIDEISLLYYNTIHWVNSRDYNREQIEAWAPEVYDFLFWAERFEKKQVYVADDDQMVVGFTEFEASGHIDCFYVHHQWQRRGVGARLIQRIEQEADKKSVPRLFVDVSITARPFFERMGFMVVQKEEVEYRGVFFKQFHMEKRCLP